MKNAIIQKASLITLAFGCFTLFCCTSNVLTGQTVKETRNLPDFFGVSLAFSGNVYITQGTPQKVEIEAEKNTLEIIETKIDNNTLVLKTKSGHWHDLGKISVYITMSDISHLSVSGSGDMICKTPLRSNEIKFEVSGSGSVNVNNLETTNVSAIITGSGDIILAGTGDEQCELNATITGSGSFKAEELQVGTADIRITGSGSVMVNVVKELETNITGSGSVFYKGNPVVNANATGSGHTRSIN